MAFASSGAALLLALLTVRVCVADGSLASDLYWADVSAAMRSEHLSTLMRALHAWQGRLVTAALLLWAGVLLWRRRWIALLMLGIAVPGGMVVNAGFKLLIARPRPVGPGAVAVHGYAYPSGHVVAITLFCGCLVFEAFRRSANSWWRAAVCALGVAVIALVAISRVYLGVHQASDALAGVLLGVAWLGLCWRSNGLPSAPDR